jgi:hypothetical protein
MTRNTARAFMSLVAPPHIFFAIPFFLYVNTTLSKLSSRLRDLHASCLTNSHTKWEVEVRVGVRISLARADFGAMNVTSDFKELRARTSSHGCLWSCCRSSFASPLVTCNQT